MATSGSGGEPGRPWTATSTWAPAGGAAVEEALSFETTAIDAETPPSAVVLARPPSDGGEDPTPCEVTGRSSFFSWKALAQWKNFARFDCELLYFNVPSR